MTLLNDFTWTADTTQRVTPPFLASHDVHIWYVSGVPDPSHVSALAQLLAPAERTRAATYYTSLEKTRYISRWGILRQLLAHYLHQSPDQLTVHIGLYGKPQLTDSTPHPQIQFNLTHRDDHILYAFTRHRQVGIDLEYLHTRFDTMQLATRFFTVHEQRLLRSLPRSQQPTAVLACWTRKEAYVKATGEGLTRGLTHFEVTVLPTTPVQLLAVHGCRDAAAKWTMQSLPAPPGYHATLVVEGRDWTPRYLYLNVDAPPPTRRNELPTSRLRLGV